MKQEVKAALIAALVALLTVFASSYIDLLNLESKRHAWVTEYQMFAQKELFRSRLELYPELLILVMPLSAKASNPITPSECKKVAYDINKWFFSKGGVIASYQTIGVLHGLRDMCTDWVSGEQPKKLSTLMKMLFDSVRQDLDITEQLYKSIYETKNEMYKMKKRIENLAK